MIRQIFEIARKRDPDNPMLMQQEAIFEMRSEKGRLEKATELLHRANRLAPHNKAISHSLSELAYKKSTDARTKIERHKYRGDARELAYQLINTGTITSHPYHTIVKIELDELGELIPSEDELSIERKIKGIERQIAKALQQFPDDSYLLDMEAELNRLISRHQKALTALEKAFKRNKRSTYIASRLAKMYEFNNDMDQAIRVMRESVDSNPNDPNSNYQLASLLIRTPDSKSAEILYYLKNSFTFGDSNFNAQFWYARYLYIEGDHEEANRIFKFLGNSNIDIRIKQEPRGFVEQKGEKDVFRGTVTKVEASFAFIVRDGLQDSIFAHRKYTDPDQWEKLAASRRVKFNLGFNYRGPFGVNIRLERDG